MKGKEEIHNQDIGCVGTTYPCVLRRLVLLLCATTAVSSEAQRVVGVHDNARGANMVLVPSLRFLQDEEGKRCNASKQKQRSEQRAATSVWKAISGALRSSIDSDFQSTPPKAPSRVNTPDLEHPTRDTQHPPPITTKY